MPWTECGVQDLDGALAMLECFTELALVAQQRSQVFVSRGEVRVLWSEGLLHQSKRTFIERLRLVVLTLETVNHERSQGPTYHNGEQSS